jgi:hypothetical protein
MDETLFGPGMRVMKISQNGKIESGRGVRARVNADIRVVRP